MPNLKEQYGIVAILDALGAASFTNQEVKRFFKYRDVVVNLLNEKSERLSNTLDVRRVKTFTFNDTVLIVFEGTGKMLTYDEIRTFFYLLRKLIVDSLANKILFRGSLAIGSFYMNEATNTIMGPAISDAAAWYEKTEWIGIIATPRSSVFFRHMQEKDKIPLHHIMLDYDVPLKNGKTVKLKAVNWPKVFLVKTLTPCRKGERPNERMLQLLSEHKMPLGTEDKYFNTILFFNHALNTLKQIKRAKRKVGSVKSVGKKKLIK